MAGGILPQQGRGTLDPRLASVGMPQQGGGPLSGQGVLPQPQQGGSLGSNPLWQQFKGMNPQYAQNVENTMGRWGVMNPNMTQWNQMAQNIPQANQPWELGNYLGRWANTYGTYGGPQGVADYYAQSRRPGAQNFDPFSGQTYTGIGGGFNPSQRMRNYWSQGGPTEINRY